MTEEPTVSVVREGSVVTITAGGLLDLSNSQEFARELRAASETAELIVVDFHDAAFIDTAIVQYLASAAIGLRKRNGKLQVRLKQGSHPARVLDILGFKQFMAVEVL